MREKIKRIREEMEERKRMNKQPVKNISEGKKEIIGIVSGGEQMTIGQEFVRRRTREEEGNRMGCNE